MSRRLAVWGVVLTCLAGAVHGAGPEKKTVGDFTLSDPRDGKEVRFSALKDRKAIVVVFLGTQCPINNAFLPELARIHKEFAPRGVQLIGINSNAQDRAAAVAEHARKHELPFPVLKDSDNKVADRFGAERTPEAFVLDPAGKILYRGRIDDQFGIGYQRAGLPTRRDLVSAIEEVLAGKPVSVASTPIAGCRIGRVVEPKNEGAITYTKHIAPILQKNCQECHRPGHIGPMSLVDYKHVLAWSDTIKEVVADRRMPPWYANPKHGKFRNDRRLSDEDRKTLLAWLANGTPKGDDRDLPPPVKYPEGWVIGEPDVVIKMPKPFDVPEKGIVPYQYIMVDPGFKEDKWVVRAEAKPGAAAVVHHIVVFVIPPGEFYNPDNPGQTLCGMAPGEMPLKLRDGLGKKIPARSRLLLQIHYTPNGKAQRDQSSIGLIFAKEPPKHQVLTKPIYNLSFITRKIRIPAGADNFKMEADFVLDRDSHVLAFMPHMHLRGKSFRYEAIYPDGKTEVLLDVPRYNFNWQSAYALTEPKAMPKGTRIHCTAYFDNSSKNPHNPDPTQDVYWGDQTWQEMLVGWMDYYHDEVGK
jgi:peroxiredoxin